jgi:HK97 family phage major capsid protein
MAQTESNFIENEIRKVKGHLETVTQDQTLKSDERRAALATLAFQKRDLENRLSEARDAERFVADNPDHEKRAAALRNSTALPGSTDAEGEWRGLLPSRTEIREMQDSETRAESGTEYLIPSGVAAKYVDMLRAKAVFLKGIPAENLIPFNDRKWTMPVLSDSDMPALVAENALITEGDDEWVGLEFDAKKYADYRTVGNETLADSGLSLRNALGQTMIRNLAVQFDADAFAGAGGTTTPILGLVGQGVSTDATATGTATFDDIADAIGRLWAANADPSVIWLAPDAAIALSKEREGTEGNYVADADSAVGLARRLPQLVSTNVPAGSVVVADGSRVYAGIREDARVAVSEHAEFQSDKTALRLTQRCAGVYVVESSSVQVIAENAG